MLSTVYWSEELAGPGRRFIDSSNADEDLREQYVREGRRRKRGSLVNFVR